MNLAIDPRTAQAYASAVSRGAADPQAGVPDSAAPSAALLLRTLGPDETATWISWAYEIHQTSVSMWWTELTAAGADGGSDVRASSAAAQVKHYSGSAVGAPAVQQLRGAAVGLDWVSFYALSGYTKAALDFAKAASVALFTYDLDGAVEPVSSAAEHRMERAGLSRTPCTDEFTLQQEASRLGQQVLDTAWQNFLETATRALQTLTHSRPRCGP